MLQRIQGSTYPETQHQTTLSKYWAHQWFYIKTYSCSDHIFHKRLNYWSHKRHNRSFYQGSKCWSKCWPHQWFNSQSNHWFNKGYNCFSYQRSNIRANNKQSQQQKSTSKYHVKVSSIDNSKIPHINHMEFHILSGSSTYYLGFHDLRPGIPRICCRNSRLKYRVLELHTPLQSIILYLFHIHYNKHK